MPDELPQTTVAIPGLDGKWRQIEARYDYATARTKCPNCGGIGWCWLGWFTCDAACSCVALVSDGRAFLPAEEAVNGH